MIMYDIDRTRRENESMIKSLMRLLLENDETERPLMPGELMTELFIRTNRFQELKNYVEYNVERNRLLEKFCSDFQVRAPACFSYGGEYAFGPGTWLNSHFGLPEDAIMPKLADSMIEIYNTFIRFHPHYNQTKLVRNPDDKFSGMKFENSVCDTTRPELFGPVLDVLNTFFYKDEARRGLCH